MKQSIKKIVTNEKFQLLIVFGLLLITCSNFYYVDVNSNIRQGINFWKALFTGDFFHYYSINIASVEAGEMIHYANYDMVMNFFMGIMGLPLYIVEAVYKVNVLDYALGRIVAKCIYPVVIMLAGDFLRITVREMLEGVKNKSEYSLSCMTKANNAAFMFITGTLVISSTCVITQADIFGITFIILAFRYLFRNDMKRFMLFFILAVQCKNFALFLFIPVIMLIEKNLVKMGVMFVSPLLVTKIIEFPFTHIDPAGSVEKKHRLWSMFGTMMDTKVPLLGVEIPVLFLLYGSVCIIAYMIKSPEEADRLIKIKKMVYIAFCGMVAFFFSMRTYAYWIIYLAPLIVFLTVLRSEKNEANNFRHYFVECFASFSIIAGFMVKYYSEYFIANVTPMLAGVIFPTEKTAEQMFDLYNFNQFVTQDVYYNIWTLSYAVFVVYCIYIMIFDCPWKNGAKVNTAEDDKMPFLSMRAWLWIRAAAGFAFCNLGVWLYLVQR